VLALQALTHQLEGNLDGMEATLAHLLPLAEPEGYVRLFVDEGKPMQQLLEKMKDKGGMMKEYIEKLLAAFEDEPPERFEVKDKKNLYPSSFIPQPLIEPLSERELEILGLIANGMSNTEIANQIFVTVGTVKWHLNNIYGKLSVRSRTQAIVKAREFGLLSG
jgi:LuxR family maltose regulon positive regulatory protein